MLAPCLQCGYMIDAQQGTRCSECGWVLSNLEADTLLRRAERLDSWQRHEPRTIALWIVIASLCSLVWTCSLWIQTHVLSTQLIWVASALPVYCSIQLALVYAISRLSPDHHRSLIRAAWAQSYMRLSMPWLSVVPLSLMIIAITWFLGAFESLQSWRSLAMVILGMLVITSWLMMCLVSSVSWFGRYSECCFEGWVHECTLANSFILVLGGLSLLVNILLGIWIGVDLLGVLRLI